MERLNGLPAIAIGVLMAVGAICLFFRFLVGYALYDLHNFFEEGSLMWGLVHTNLWLVMMPIGALVGVLHKWWKDEDIYRRGLEELRLWRIR